MPVLLVVCTVSYTGRGEEPQRIAHVFSLPPLSFFQSLSLSQQARCDPGPRHELNESVSAQQVGHPASG